jgi:hypothetical protein
MPEVIARLLEMPSPEVRAAAVFALGSFIGTHEPVPGAAAAERQSAERAIACHLLDVVYDASPLVRAEAAVALARIASGHSLFFQARRTHLAELGLGPAWQRSAPPRLLGCRVAGLLLGGGRKNTHAWAGAWA